MNKISSGHKIIRDIIVTDRINVGHGNDGKNIVHKLKQIMHIGKQSKNSPSYGIYDCDDILQRFKKYK